ncbi:MAG: hypothetical protein IPJ69_14295 [Deltaproteobacteria bacterium]|nr:MAG: hypothetical protein IPJ69_14295 [Deltaproteobacteria bacterium]
MNKVTKYAKEASVVLKSLPDQSRLYPINFNLKGPSLLNWDIAHIWAMYPDEKIVFSPYLFAFDWFESLSKKQGSSVNYFPATEESFPVNISSICKTTSPFKTIDCQKLREQAFQEIFKSSSYYDYWLVHQTPEDFLSYLQSFKGLKMVAQSGDFMLWHYEEAHEFIPPLNQHLP